MERDQGSDVDSRKTPLVHLILLHRAPNKMMHRALGIDLSLILARRICQLSATDDVEIVVCGVSARVALCADCCPCNEKMSCGRDRNRKPIYRR